MIEQAKQRADAILSLLRYLVSISRYGRREKLYVLVGALLLGCAGAGGFIFGRVPEPFTAWFDWFLIVAGASGILCLLVGAWVICRRVVAPPLPEEASQPSAIKGVTAFGPEDAALFTRLGRNEEVATLRDWILDPQVGLIVLMGESGVGKTSLLRAGLPSRLEQDDPTPVYWEAQRTNAVESLLHAVQAHEGEAGAAAPSMDELCKPSQRERRVIFLDQFEQLSPERHRAIFDALKRVAEQDPPFQTTWVVAFREGYTFDWRTFELDLQPSAQHRIRTLPLRRFSQSQADQVVAVLLTESGIDADYHVVTDLLEGSAVDGKVSPVDIGIALLVLRKMAGDAERGTVTREIYRASGGHAGLLSRYVERRLSILSEPERREALEAMLQLADLERDQRRAEGCSAADLVRAVKPLDPRRFQANLGYLASPNVRLVQRASAQGDAYRLPHDRIIPALRRVAGVHLAEVDQAKRVLDRQYGHWREDPKRANLLTGKDLRQVLRYQRDFALGDSVEAKQGFIQRSVRRRNRRLAALLVYGALSVVAGVVTLDMIRGDSDRARLKAWSLPEDLYDIQTQLTSLSVDARVARLDWLKPGLQRLTLRNARVPSLVGLPSTLNSLEVHSVTLSSLAGLPEGVTSLALHDCDGMTSLVGLPEGLKSLALHYCDGITSLAGLPAGLRSLGLVGLGGLTAPVRWSDDLAYSRDITLADIASLECLPDALASLEVHDCDDITSLTGLPSGLTSLEVRNCDGITSLAGLPSGLTSLEVRDCDGISGLGRLPDGLTSLDLGFCRSITTLAGLPHGLASLGLRDCDGITSLADLPEGLMSLDLSYCDGITSLAGLPEGLMSLDLSYCDGIAGLAGLPASLASLNLCVTKSTRLGDVPAGLKSLDVSGCEGITSLAGLPEGLTSLALHDCDGITSLAGLPEGLTSLALRACDGITSLAGLPAGLVSLDLYATKTTRLRGMPAGLASLDLGFCDGITSLAGLPDGLMWLNLEKTKIASLAGSPNSLESLDVSGCDGITSLAGLPDGLVSLDLEATKLTSLAGLPRSVTDLKL